MDGAGLSASAVGVFPCSASTVVSTMALTERFAASQTSCERVSVATIGVAADRPNISAATSPA